MQPATYTDADGNTVKPLGDIEAEALALVASLDDSQQKRGGPWRHPIDLVLGPGQDGKTIQAEGFAASQTDRRPAGGLPEADRPLHRSCQRRRGVRAHRRNQGRSRRHLFRLVRPDHGGNAGYCRVTGPTIVIEYAPQGGGRGGSAAASTGAHPRHLPRPDQRLRRGLHRNHDLILGTGNGGGANNPHP